MSAFLWTLPDLYTWVLHILCIIEIVTQNYKLLLSLSQILLMYCLLLLVWNPPFCFSCRSFTVQESSIVLGLLLVVISGWLVLSCIHSGICFGRFLHGLRVNICHQLCIALHQPQTKEGDWRNKAKGRIDGAVCEIQRPLFSLLSCNHTGSGKKILSLSVSLFSEIQDWMCMSKDL